MRKILWTTALFVFVLLFALLLFIQFSPSILSNTLTKMLQTKVTVKNIDYQSRAFTLEDFSLYNPPKYKIKKALSVKKTTFTTPYLNYIKPHTVIDKIELSDIDLSIIFTDSDNKRGNWYEIFSKLDSPSNEKKNQEDTGSNRSVLIKELVLNNVEITLVRYGKSPLKLKPIKHIKLENINSSDGLPTKQITRIIVRQVIKSVSIFAGITDMLESFTSVPADVADFVFKPFSFLFGGGNKKGEDSQDNRPTSPYDQKQSRSGN